MSRSGVSIDPQCISTYDELKLQKKLKYIIFKLNDTFTQIVVEHTSESKDWDEFRERLLSAKSAAKGREGAGPRYAVYDVEYQLKNGEGTRNKIIFLSWSPDEGALIAPKMTYASSKESFKNGLSGLATEVQANNEDDLEWNSIVNDVSKGQGVA